MLVGLIVGSQASAEIAATKKMGPAPKTVKFTPAKKFVLPGINLLKLKDFIPNAVRVFQDIINLVKTEKKNLNKVIKDVMELFKLAQQLQKLPKVKKEETLKFIIAFAQPFLNKANQTFKDAEGILNKSRAIIKEIFVDLLAVIKAQWTDNAIKFITAADTLAETLTKTVEKGLPVLIEVLNEIQKEEAKLATAKAAEAARPQ